MTKFDKTKKPLEDKTRETSITKITKNTNNLRHLHRINAMKNGAAKDIDIYNEDYQTLKEITKEYELLGGISQWRRNY